MEFNKMYDQIVDFHKNVADMSVKEYYQTKNEM